MSLIRSCMCDVCGRSQSFDEQNWNRPLQWAGVALEVRISLGATDIRKMDLCPQCIEKLGTWTEDVEIDKA